MFTLNNEFKGKFLHLPKRMNPLCKYKAIQGLEVFSSLWSHNPSHVKKFKAIEIVQLCREFDVILARPLPIEKPNLAILAMVIYPSKSDRQMNHEEIAAFFYHVGQFNLPN